jgi:glycosyltransferase involved in cell wall biosynthesis
MVSVIIPAYKATKYIDQCLDSIQGAEILVGVDGCQETFDHLKNRSDIRLFFFPENVGPYIIKNTLINQASNEHILFFDSDDVLAEGVIDRIDEKLAINDYIRLNYVNFYNKIDDKGNKMNDAVIAIKRHVFNSLNGFYPWVCAADTEFHNRLIYNKLRSTLLDGVAYYRRLHGENLTMRKETGHGSAIRNKYVEYINNCQRTSSWLNPQTKTTKDYVTY